MLDCREQKTIEKLSEELEKAGYTHISFQVVHTKSRTTSVRGHKYCKKTGQRGCSLCNRGCS